MQRPDFGRADSENMPRRNPNVIGTLPDCDVAGYEFVYPEPIAYPLPAPKDVPYLLAELASGAKYLVTGNGNDFPADVCVGVDVVTPAAFLQLDIASMTQFR